MSSSSHLGRSVAALLAAGALALGTTSTSMALPQTSATPHSGETSVLDAGYKPMRQNPTRDTSPGTYIVTMIAKPSAVYAGGVPGFAATKARPGERFDRTRPDVARYENLLAERQGEILDGIDEAQPLYSFTTAVNGFAADLSTEQVKRLRATDGVALVEKSTRQRIDTVDSPDVLGLGAAWAEVGGSDEAGRGSVIGVIDSGIWPENPSFAGLPLKSPGRAEQVRGFNGACLVAEQWDRNDCNDKVISARYFVRGFGQQNVAKSEYLSPRDGGGHGSLTASAAAGNSDVAVQIEGQDFGSASGMAPAARIAAYKVCWVAPNPDDDGCATADTVAAIDQAVADGVDVINYSISGSQESAADSVQLAFLNASDAGVFVAASAGNTGPRASTVAHLGPWVTTVGASSHHVFEGSVILDGGDGPTYVGAMLSDGTTPRTRLVLSADVAAPGATTGEARICEAGSLDSSLVQDSIVVCDRGATARVDKSEAVARAGGAGMVLVNVSPDSTEPDLHSVPTVHVDSAAGEAIKAYVRGSGSAVSAAIDPTGSDETLVPQIGGFSSRGPSSAAGGDILKPDLTAPGVSVVGAVAPPSNAGRLWGLYSGTSMSAPHVAGLAAFITAEKPDWSPAEIKSAMMTTADALRGRAGPFAEGAGNVDPTEFLEPGLVFPAKSRDYHGFLAGQGFTYADGTPVSDTPIRASQLNLPSIAVGSLTSPVSVTRRVTNLSSNSQTFAAEITGLAGVDAQFTPETFTIGGGKTRKFTVRFTPNENASFGNYAKGGLTLTSLNSTVRIPLVVKPELVAAPDEVSDTSDTGSVTIEGVSGTDEDIELRTAGLVETTPTGLTLVPGAFDTKSPGDDPDTFRVAVNVPEYTEVARFQMDAHNAADDMDLYVYRGDELVGVSATGSADETVTLVQPEPGDYAVYVNSHSAANGSTTTGQFYGWVVGPGDTGNLKLATTSIQSGTGDRFSFEASWDQLGSNRWFGAIRYGESGHRTLITIE